MLNQVAIMGRMATEPEMRQTETGKMVTSFRVAVNRDRKNANGEREGDFFTCIAWGKTAEFVCAHFPKGAQLALTGRLQSHAQRSRTPQAMTPLPLLRMTATCRFDDGGYGK